MNKKLVQVHSDQAHRVWCSCCDTDEGVETNVWYEVKDPIPYSVEISQKFLPCCLQKVGVVVDWEDRNFTKKLGVRT